MYDSAVLMQIELGAAKAEAHAIVDGMMGLMKH
jgi:hypothetical protein